MHGRAIATLVVRVHPSYAFIVSRSHAFLIRAGCRRESHLLCPTLAATRPDRAEQFQRPSSRTFRHDMIIHLVGGTYEFFRHFYGLQRSKSKGLPFGAVAGVLGTVIQMLEEGATHLGVATDHIIESFRNDLWPGYKTGLGIEPALHAQFVPLEEALVAMGIATWPMVELEADDALAS